MTVLLFEKRALLVIAGLMTSCLSCSQPARTTPNFVFILADDCTYWDLGCYGSQDAITPNIDRLANEGMRFTHCFQAVAMCSPTRCNLMTGMYPVKTGAFPNFTFVKEGTKSIVHYLEPLGYRVALSGKIHLEPPEAFPFEYLGDPDNPAQWPNFELVGEFLNESRRDDQRFCLFLTPNSPHLPWTQGDATLFEADELTLPPFYVDTPVTRRELTKYFAEINFLDRQVGQVLDMLKTYQLDKNTIVVFASEHGNTLPFAKWTCYDAGVQSAFIVRCPGIIPAGTVSDAIVEYTDVVPTLVELAGGQPASSLDGKSMADLWRGNTKTHKDYAFSLQTTRGISYGSEHYGIRSIRSDRYRYIVNLTPEIKFENLVTHNNPVWESWAAKAASNPKADAIIQRFQHRPAMELYDVRADRYCMNNLAADPIYKDVVTKLDKRLKAWMAACGDQGQETEMLALQHRVKLGRGWSKGGKIVPDTKSSPD